MPHRPLLYTRAYCPGMRVTYNKLIRDKIPEAIQLDGHHAVTRTLDGDLYRSALVAKLVEEALEAQAASLDDLPGELVDIFEVLQALLPTLSMTWQDLLALADTKRNQRGGFAQR